MIIIVTSSFSRVTATIDDALILAEGSEESLITLQEVLSPTQSPTYYMLGKVPVPSL